MKKALPTILIVALAGGVGFLAWWMFSGGDSKKPPANNGSDEQPAPDFDPKAFIATFDQDGNKLVTPEEFNRMYGKDKIIFHPAEGEEALTAEQAFQHWDKDKNGVIDGGDIKRVTDKAWENHFLETMKQGLLPKDHHGDFLKLSKIQFRLYQREEAAAIAGELPFAGEYFDAKYVDTWGELTHGREKREGFIIEQRGKYWILTADRKLSVFDKSETNVRYMPDAPPSQYAAEIREIEWDDTQANLELARKADQWGMDQEAKLLYERVLIFDGDNSEALETLKLEYVNGRHILKGE